MASFRISSGLETIVIVIALFTTLKLTNQLDWPWWKVASPILIPLFDRVMVEYLRNIMSRTRQDSRHYRSASAKNGIRVHS